MRGHKGPVDAGKSALAVLSGIDKVVGADDAISFFVHGTTVGLNALLTRRGAKVALVTNENFRDIYTIQGNDRGEIFSIRWNKPAPLTPVEHTFTIAGRMLRPVKKTQPCGLKTWTDWSMWPKPKDTKQSPFHYCSASRTQHTSWQCATICKRDCGNTNRIVPSSQP